MESKGGDRLVKNVAEALEHTTKPTKPETWPFKLKKTPQEEAQVNQFEVIDENRASRAKQKKDEQRVVEAKGKSNLLPNTTKGWKYYRKRSGELLLV